VGMIIHTDSASARNPSHGVEPTRPKGVRTVLLSRSVASTKERIP
jgi:hypothetical protein